MTARALPESRESRMVVVERNEDGTPTVWCDPEIVDLVAALNTAGIRTVASCSGHGERHGNIALSDGRELLILPDFDSARKAERAIASSLAEQPAHSRAQDSGGEAVVPAGWCTLGVGDGSGNLFVHGPYEAIKACQRLILASEQPAKGEGQQCTGAYALWHPERREYGNVIVSDPSLLRDDYKSHGYVIVPLATPKPSDPADAEKFGGCTDPERFTAQTVLLEYGPVRIAGDKEVVGQAIALLRHAGFATPATVQRQAPSVDAAAVLAVAVDLQSYANEYKRTDGAAGHEMLSEWAARLCEISQGAKQ